MQKLKIGINGFGRIGRAFARINLKYGLYDLVAINEMDPDINNLAYLLKYDSTYGKLHNHKIDVNGTTLLIDDSMIKITSESNINNVNWSKYGVELIVDSSGVFHNLKCGRDVIESGVKKILVTHSPREGVDFTYMNGVNETLYEKEKHNIISTSICDANAVAPFYKVINDEFGIELAEITTLHPWLSYQNLLDGNLKSVSSPGHFWKDYALGRGSIGSLIPKDTSLVSALHQVLPGIDHSVHATSFRVPTSIVSAAEGVFLLKNSTTLESILASILRYIQKYQDVLVIDDRSFVSIDHLGNENAAVIDKRWMHLNGGRMLKFVLWYDNEWGYTKKVYDFVKHAIRG